MVSGLSHPFWICSWVMRILNESQAGGKTISVPKSPKRNDTKKKKKEENKRICSKISKVSLLYI